MPPNYESQTFWDTRFKKEEHFEWLDDGRDTIVPVLREHLRTHAEADPESAGPPLVLHIGAGTSTLSNDIVEAHQSVYGRPPGGLVVLNTDFAQEAVRRGTAAGGRAEVVAWAQLDLLEWRDMRAMRDRVEEVEGRRFAFVVDKSTTDAIACRGDMGFSQQACEAAAGDYHPAIVAAALASPTGYIDVHPAAVLAHHLAALVQAGGVWIVLSYSSNRFPFLTYDSNDQDSENKIEASARAFWRLERVQAVKVKEEGTAGESTVHTPELA
ncbi:hypothetical protein PHLGIDRAFT_115737 [Phlebiopsis gigantea 11061_1 CR5-6]|uniref:Methyltransferase domain-containing protein n=1 Tax=Phlebiopsis gigantea (strain 11061_1 CR5-6) TaxID=745531 RepID=A0A0C3SE00_PHLG1|nr:hypothetical protein PHLGIDRAFT_115737 [Phlebiopsis gigantea 11061_1 CR5-6]